MDKKNKRMLQAPFPYCGGKSRVSSMVWAALGANIRNYVEPFAGTLAVLLGRQDYDPLRHFETVNDLDGFICNTWRAMKHDPEGLAKICDWPINEIDLESRHRWLVKHERIRQLRDLLTDDPEGYDLKVAGWWLWGACCWLGTCWCEADWGTADLGNIAERRVPRKRPHLFNRHGVHRLTISIPEWFEKLSGRLRQVRVCSGDWSRVCKPAVTTEMGLTGVFLDPPYAAKRAKCYGAEDFSIANDVRKWCLEHGDDPLLRIVLAGYEGEHNELEAHGWGKREWKAQGGFGNQSENGRGRENARLERLWLSPHCVVEPSWGMGDWSWLPAAVRRMREAS